MAPCLDGREPRETALTLFIERFENRPLPAPAEAPKPAQGPEADELLQIFLEEAREVLANIEGALTVAREQPNNEEALSTLRRGFHTLKGSGRMVGLTALGDAAWEVEQVMNRWLDEKQPATPELLDTTGEAAKHFATWVEKLAAGEAPHIDPGVIAGLTQRLKPEVGQIYLKEARTHVVTLEAQCKRWCANPGTSTTGEFVRAAHTLASSSRTAGYEGVANLAAALEQWMPVAGLTVENADTALIAGVVARLTEMVTGLNEKATPAPADDLVGQMSALCARLQPPAKPKEKRILRDDIDGELLPIFLEEAQELVPQIARRSARMEGESAGSQDRRGA